MAKRVVFVADSLDNAYKFQQVLASLEVEVAAGSTLQLKKLLLPEASPDLIIFEARGEAALQLDGIAASADEVGCPLLAIVDGSTVLELPALIALKGDFVLHGASPDECRVRVQRLLSEVADAEVANVIAVDNMVVNLATYQVTVSDDPVDLTYLEYSLLTFLVRHPGHTFSRNELLQHVWGFDYYGGSRTVDVHVRRIRSKLGPELAQRLETVRGVGYLWNC